MEGVENTGVVTEVPDNLKTLCLLLVKTFYGLHCYVLLDYVQRLGCVKEDKLRDILKLDPRYLRQLIVDKFLKERTIAEENEGRSKKVNYYHVNYKAILNVTKYKIDHMRQKLEHKEQSHVQKSSYICSMCKRHYEALDIHSIYNAETQQLTCWQCNSEVIPDETAGPSEETRSSLAKFNEDLAVIFSMLQQMDGIRFSRQILEPPITIIPDEPKDLDGQQRLQVGARMFSNAEKTRSDLYANGITVSIGEKQEVQVESKEKVPWLQHSTHDDVQPSGVQEPTNGFSAMEVEEVQEEVPEPSFLAPLLGDAASADIGALLIQIEGHRDTHSEAASPTRSVHKESVDLSVDGKAADDVQSHNANGHNSSSDFPIYVQGSPVRLEDITTELVQKMSSDERQAYIDYVMKSIFF